MTYSIRFHTEAESEMDEAVEYLNGESPGLGEIFLNDIKHAVDLITPYPEIALIVEGPVRRKLLRKFPCSLIYSIVGGNPDSSSNTSR